MNYYSGSKAIKNSEINIYNREPFRDDYETIERKGLGHPDTIADALASKISRDYSNYTIRHCQGLILHHQIDKLMVIGGKTKLTFGKGIFIRPIKIIVAGRASNYFAGKRIPINKIILKTIREYFRVQFPSIIYGKDYLVENNLTSYAGPGTITSSEGAIANMFNPKNQKQVKGYDNLVANDTSYCVAYSPLSKLEKSILNVERYLNSKNTKNVFPWLGSDIKIMAARNRNDVSITACVPQIAKYVRSIEDYKDNLNLITKLIYRKFTKLLPEYNIDLSINTKDDYEKMNIYLTVSGASLSGDIGVSGRGNRTNGLITSNRPMSLEGTNGKNPRYYSGFIYAILSKNISKAISKQTGRSNIVEIVAQNGAPLDKPWKIRVTSKAKKKVIKNIINAKLKGISSITRSFLKGNIINY